MELSCTAISRVLQKLSLTPDLWTACTTNAYNLCPEFVYNPYQDVYGLGDISEDSMCVCFLFLLLLSHKSPSFHDSLIPVLRGN